MVKFSLLRIIATPWRAASGQNEARKRQREWFAFWVVGVVFLLATLLMARAGREDQSFANSVVFFGIINLNVILLMLLVFLFIRNTTKFFLERRKSRIRTRLQAKLIVGFVGFAFVPTVILFTVAAFYISNSFDRWFSRRIGNSLKESVSIVGALEKNVQDRLLTQGEVLLEQRRNGDDLEGLLSYWLTQLRLDSVIYYRDPWETPKILGALNAPLLTLEDIQKVQEQGKISFTHWGKESDEYVQAAFQLPKGGVLVLSQRLPDGFAETTSRIQDTSFDYRSVSPLQAPLKTVYLVLLLTMTLMILFVALWAGVFLARQWTTPITRLVQGIQLVRQGNYDIQIPVLANDEIGLLISSFNQLAGDLQNTTRELESTIVQKDNERVTLETVLANMHAAVFLLDENLGVILKNPRANFSLNADMLDVAKEAITAGIAFKMFADQSSFAGTWSLDARKVGQGVLLVFEDRTEVLRKQREETWREAARRVAHEIKNPLTPIRLAAERLKKRYSPLLSGQDLQVLDQSTSTIVEQTEVLKRMVNEFSQFARFPEIQRTTGDLVDIVLSLVQFYRQTFPQIQWEVVMDETTPEFAFDNDGIRRLLINVIDNAREALGNQGKISIRQFYNQSLQKCRLEILDNGPGIREEDLKKIFEPYYSTKPKGSGLGLAIAKRIAQDHGGDIRVNSDQKQGTVFVLELPTEVRDTVQPSVWT